MIKVAGIPSLLHSLRGDAMYAPMADRLIIPGMDGCVKHRLWGAFVRVGYSVRIFFRTAPRGFLPRSRESGGNARGA